MGKSAVREGVNRLKDETTTNLGDNRSNRDDTAKRNPRTIERRTKASDGTGRRSAPLLATVRAKAAAMFLVVVARNGGLLVIEHLSVDHAGIALRRRAGTIAMRTSTRIWGM